MFMNISDLRQEISVLREERLKAENKLIQVKKMLPCSLILRRVLCGNSSCKCQEGKLHGPYPYLSEKRKRKTHLTYIRKRDLEKVERKTEQYRLFQKRLEYVRHSNRRIDDLFKRIREMRIEESRKTKDNRKK